MRQSQIFYLLDFLLTSDSLLPYCKQSLLGSLTGVHIRAAVTEVGAPLARVLKSPGDCHHLGGLLVDGSHDCRKQDRNED